MADDSEETMSLGQRHDLEFSLKRWRLDVSADNGLGRYSKLKLKGLNVTGFSDFELERIRAFSKSMEGCKVSRMNSFTADMFPLHLSNMRNSEGLEEFDYVEREFGVFGSESDIRRVEAFIDQLPTRTFETFVIGLTRKQIEKVCYGSNHRIMQDRYKPRSKVFAVSTDCNRVCFELFMRSKSQGEST